MSDFGETARRLAFNLNYTEVDAKEMAASKAKTVGDVVAEQFEEPRLDEVCAGLGLDSSGLDNPATPFGPDDIALAAWSNWGAGSVSRAVPRSSLSESEFIVLNDYFEDIAKLSE